MPGQKLLQLCKGPVSECKVVSCGGRPYVMQLQFRVLYSCNNTSNLQCHICRRIRCSHSFAIAVLQWYCVLSCKQSYLMQLRQHVKQFSSYVKK